MGNYLRTLVVEEGFMFGRKFAKGTMVEDADSLKPLNETLPDLWREAIETHTSGRLWTSNDRFGVPGIPRDSSVHISRTDYLKIIAILTCMTLCILTATLLAICADRAKQSSQYSHV